MVDMDECKICKTVRKKKHMEKSLLGNTFSGSPE